MESSNVIHTVLVVDDDPEWREFMNESLKDSYDVITAAGSEAALKAATESKPSAIVLDVMMETGRDGFSTFCLLQKDEQTKNIPVIMFSEVNSITKLQFDEEQMSKYLQGEPFAFVEKPVKPDELARVVGEAIRSRS